MDFEPAPEKTLQTKGISETPTINAPILPHQSVLAELKHPYIPSAVDMSVLDASSRGDCDPTRPEHGVRKTPGKVGNLASVLSPCIVPLHVNSSISELDFLDVSFSDLTLVDELTRRLFREGRYMFEEVLVCRRSEVLASLASSLNPLTLMLNLLFQELQTILREVVVQLIQVRNATYSSQHRVVFQEGRLRAKARDGSDTLLRSKRAHSLVSDVSTLHDYRATLI
jgi:hypothetical protein